MEQENNVRTATQRISRLLELVATHDPTIQKQPYDIKQKLIRTVPFDEPGKDTKYVESVSLSLRWGKLEPTPEETRLMNRTIPIRRGPDEIIKQDYQQITVDIGPAEVIIYGQAKPVPPHKQIMPLSKFLGPNLLGKGLGASFYDAVRNPEKVKTPPLLRANKYKAS